MQNTPLSLKFSKIFFRSQITYSKIDAFLNPLPAHPFNFCYLFECFLFIEILAKSPLLNFSQFTNVLPHFFEKHLGLFILVDDVGISNALVKRSKTVSAVLASLGTDFLLRIIYNAVNLSIQLSSLFDTLSILEFGIIMDLAVDLFFYEFIVFHLCNSFRLLFLCLLRFSFLGLSKLWNYGYSAMDSCQVCI